MYKIIRIYRRKFLNKLKISNRKNYDGNSKKKQSINRRIVNRLIGQMGRVFANGSGDLGSIPGCA